MLSRNKSSEPRNKSSKPSFILRARGFFSAHFSTRTRSDSTESDNLHDLMRQQNLTKAAARKALEGLGPRDGALLVECYGNGLRAEDIRIVRHASKDVTNSLCDLVHKDDALNRYFTVLLKDELDKTDNNQAALLAALQACLELDHNDEKRIVFLHKNMTLGIRDKHLIDLEAATTKSSSHITELAAQYLAQADGLTPLAAFQLLNSNQPHFSQALIYLVIEKDMMIAAAQAELAGKSEDELNDVIPKSSVPSPN